MATCAHLIALQNLEEQRVLVRKRHVRLAWSSPVARDVVSDVPWNLLSSNIARRSSASSGSKLRGLANLPYVRDARNRKPPGLACSGAATCAAAAAEQIRWYSQPSPSTRPST